MRTEVASLEHKLRVLEAEKAALSKEYEQKSLIRKQTLANMEREIQVLLGTKEQRISQIHKLTREIEDLKQLLDEKNNDIDNYSKELEDYIRHGDAMKNTDDELQMKIEESRRGKEVLQERVEELLEENNRRMNEQDQTANEIKAGQLNISGLEMRLREVEEQTGDVRDKLKKVEKEVRLKCKLCR